MGITERKERQKTELREAILTAARRIFVEEGAAALTMRKIADAIEYSPATIYLHFANREEIALVLVREGFANLLAAFGPALGVADPVERIRAIGRAYVEFGLTDPQTYKLIFMENADYVYAAMAPGGVDQAEEAGQRAFDVVAEAIAEAVAAGAFRPVDPQRGAEAIWAAMHGLVSLHITCPVMLADPASVGRLLEEVLIAGLRA
jgi:AcrR family transcriptional regulator